jgi:MoaA/NifB/PqqE/SkfB family radical SAM enzyme
LEISSISRLEIELTNTCNLSCALCARQTIYDKLPKKEISFQKLKEFIKKLPNLKYVTLAGEYSEPTLYPELLNLIIFLHKRKIEISLFINAETKDMLFYKKLSFIFKGTNSKIFLSIFGSTEKLHQKYRGGSLQRVLEVGNVIKKFSKNNLVLTWVLFEYNENDYLENKNKFSDFNLHVFNTLPYAERYNIQGDIRLSKDLSEIYQNLDRNDLEGKCKSIQNNFGYLDVDMNIWPCSLAKHNNCSFDIIENGLKDFCYECSENNIKILNKNKIYTISESENEISEEDLFIDFR